MRLAGGLHLGQRSVARLSDTSIPSMSSEFGRSEPVQEVGPALSLLRRLDRLDEGEAGAELSEGAYPVGAVEDEVAILVRGDDYGVALLAFGLHALVADGPAGLRRGPRGG